MACTTAICCLSGGSGSGLCLLLHHVYLLSFWRIQVWSVLASAPRLSVVFLENPSPVCACFCTTSICCLSGESKSGLCLLLHHVYLLSFWRIQVRSVLASAPRLSVVFLEDPSLVCACFCTTSICCLSGESKSGLCLLLHHVYLLS